MTNYIFLNINFLKQIFIMKKTLLICLVLTFLHTFTIFSQNTVGLLSYQPSKAFDGYNLFFPHNQPTVFLLDNCGEIIHTWTDESDFRPGNIAYLREDGTLVKGKRHAQVTDDAIWAGGGGETVEIRDWDNNLLWDFTINNELERLHHDIALMSNGNILMIVWELKTEEEAIQAGRDTSKLAQDKLWPDYIIEVNPETDEIVWEWHVWDHLIQDYDETKDNFGVVADHPELIDLNWDTNDGHPDWMHTNAIDYHEELDQILISVPTFHEVWVIDHSTTTEEAAGHSGGFGGKGGDILFRWGNPAAYQSGTEADQKLFYPHDIHWIDDFLDASHPYFGKMAAFNNRVGTDFSTVNVFTPAFDMYDWTYLMSNGTFDFPEFDLTITHPTPTALYSTGLSSVQFLPNGNSLITSGRFGYTFELTPDNEIVWEYKTPIIMGNPATQGDTLAINNNLTFRMKRYPTDYTAFEGRDLSSKGWLELNPDSTFCELILPTEEVLDEGAFKVFPNPTSGQLTIEWDGMQYAEVAIYNLLGQLQERYRCSGGRKYLDTSRWEKGVYLIVIDGKYSRKVIVR